MTTTTLYTREEAAKRALATTTNVPDTCQLVTRGWLGAPSAGDFDGDGAADAEDGWKLEPTSARHTDRKPPLGTPVTYLGGSNDHGHRALSLGPDKNGVYHIRSTDAGGRGRVATVPLDWPEKNWGLKYAGWSETCDGVLIKPSPKPQPVLEPKHGKGSKVEHAIDDLEAAKGKGDRRKLIDRALKILNKIKPVK